MKKTALSLLFLSLAGLTAVEAADKLVFAPKDGPGKGKKVVLLSGDEEYRSEEALPMLAKILSQKHGFECTVLFSLDKDGTINPNLHDSLPGAEALDTADVVVMSLRFRDYPEEIMKRFDAAKKRGVAYVGLRTSTHAFSMNGKSPFKEYSSFGKKVLGEGWVSHWAGHKSQATKGIIEDANKGSDLLKGVSDIFVTTDVYEAYPPEDVKVLVRGQALAGMTPDSPPATNMKKNHDKVEQGINDPMMPIAWSREYKEEDGKVNKILCTTMGAANDLENEGLRRLVVNSVYWGAGLPVPDKADVAIVDEYHPTMYGFDGYRTGLKPEDMELGKALPDPASVPHGDPNKKKK